MKKYIFIVCIVCIILLIVAIYFFNEPIETWQKIGSIVLAFTLIFIIRYVIDTNKIANSAQKQMEYLEGPNLIIKIERLLVKDYDRVLNFPVIDIRSIMHVGTTGKFNIDAKISVVFRYGDSNIWRHSDGYYSGKEIWNIGIGHTGIVHFSINEFLKRIDLSPNDFRNRLEEGEIKNRLEMSIFSKFRRYNSGEKFCSNQPQYFYIDKDASDKKSAEKYDLVWVWEPKNPPKEMEEIAFVDQIEE